MKRKHDLCNDVTTSSAGELRTRRQSRRSIGADTGKPPTGKLEKGSRNGSGEQTKKNGFPILQLPRELRDRIYDFHLQATCETSRVRNWGGIFYSLREEEILRTVVGDGPDVGPIRPGYFYEPVFIRFSPVEPDGFLHAPDFEAREHPIPALTMMKRSLIAQEAWSHYSSKLLVHVDALNRFQTWCLETLERQKFVGLRRLFVLSFAMYHAPPDMIGPPVTDERYPCFLLQIEDDHRAITLYSRFELRPKSLVVLAANLNTLMFPILRRKRALNGEDLVEAMFALHCCRRVMDNRQQMVVGPMRKGGVVWEFQVDEAALTRVPTCDKPQSEVLLEAADRVKSFRHVLYRGECGRAEA